MPLLEKWPMSQGLILAWDSISCMFFLSFFVHCYHEHAEREVEILRFARESVGAGLGPSRVILFLIVGLLTD